MAYPPLAQFLQDIGAGSLSPTLVVPAHAEQKAPFQALHDRLQLEIDAVNVRASRCSIGLDRS